MGKRLWRMRSMLGLIVCAALMVATPVDAQTAATRLSLLVNLHGLGTGGDNANPAANGTLQPLHSMRPVTVLVYAPDTTLAATVTGNLVYNTTTGKFTTTVTLPATIASGIYTVQIATPNFLHKTIPGIITITKGQITTGSPISLVTGDANNDNKLSVLDYNMVVDCFSDLSPAKNCTDAIKKLATDLTDDGSINQFDYNLLLRELSVQTGDEGGPTPTQSTVSPTASPTPTPYQSGATLPSQLLNLTNWKITLPTGASSSPTEIKQPQLASFSVDPWFVLSSDKTGVRFRAPVNGVTTSGSSYPRSELREMTSNGTANAAWSSNTGIHTMTIEEAITAVPQTKKHVVAGQIHDASNDVIVIRLEYPKLFVDIGGTTGPILDSNYTLGKKFTVKFEVSNGSTKIYYNNSLAYTLTKSYSGAYFKAGAYTQSNCSTESTSALCVSTNYGEVVIYSLQVTQQ